MTINDAYILNNMERFEPVAVSTNKVYRFSRGGRSYILKVSHLPPDEPSPFWRGLREIFSSDFDAQRENAGTVVSLLDNPHIGTARPVAASAEHRFLVFEAVEGAAYEPDAFPDGAGIAYQLGQFIGYIHSTEYSWFGHPQSRSYAGFADKMAGAMEALIRRYWRDSADVAARFQKLRRGFTAPSTFSLIMPDISANQFIFAEDMRSIRAVVDYDAYVVGPREWELSVIEMCLKDGAAFKRGYECYRAFPDISGCRAFYRLYMYLCDPDTKQDLAGFLTRGILF